jgi:hypothetical protein
MVTVVSPSTMNQSHGVSTEPSNVNERAVEGAARGRGHASYIIGEDKPPQTTAVVHRSPYVGSARAGSPPHNSCGHAERGRGSEGA